MIFLKYFLNIIIFYIFNTLFYKYLEKRFKNIYNKNRLRYITKNIVKSIILFVLFFYTIFVNNWSNENIYNYGIIYASHDILSLIMFYDILSITTILHHLAVLILSTLNLYNNYEILNVWHGLVFYCLLSASTFYINLFLGLRFLINRRSSIIISKKIFLYYLVTCLINWLYQLYNIYFFFNIYYLFLILFIVYDDIILLKFLYSY
jgi:hypothetical protein